MHPKSVWTILTILIISLSGYGQIKLLPTYPNMIAPVDVPTDIQHAGDGSGRLFVSQLSGLIYLFPADSLATEASVFLDIEDRVVAVENLGLLGFSFDPDYASNGYFYVKYSQADGDTFCNVIARFSVSASDPDSADPASEVRLLKIPQATVMHGGGSIAFGPHDGLLYITTGDGGPFRDPSNNAQRLDRLLGKVLRIDVQDTSAGRNYAIPPGNPFAGNSDGYHEEIFAYGFRNPWRLSIDPITKRIWVGDVGASTYEEIDTVASGGNYGWKIMEGAHCLLPDTSCDTTGLALPVWEYAHPGSNGSVTGGYVYRGSLLSGLQGQYIYGDFNTGRIWALDVSTPGMPVNTLLLDANVLITSFGVDDDGELYLCSAGNNDKFYRILPEVTGIDPNAHPAARSFTLDKNYPNPFNPITVISFTIGTGQLSTVSDVELSVYDLQGRRVRTLFKGHPSAGEHSLTWNGRTDAGRPAGSGIYFYRLRSGGQQQTRVMHLVR